MNTMISKHFLVVLFLFIGISFTVRGEDPPPSVPATPAETSVAQPPKPEVKREGPRALDQKGKIEKVDAAAGTFVVEGKTFTLAKKSRVEIDGNLMTLADLKEGDLVAVVYFAKADGMNAVTRVIKGNAARMKKKSPATTSGETKPAADSK
jgi:hypothetical protein